MSDKDIVFDMSKVKLPIAICPCGATRSQCVVGIEDWVCKRCHKGSSGRDYTPLGPRYSRPVPAYGPVDRLVYPDDKGKLPLFYL